MSWVVEIDRGAINWVIIAHCHNQESAEKHAIRIKQLGETVRIRKYGHESPPLSP